ncbi:MULTISPECIES: type VI secretion system baseplate subunit TssK [Erwinia]|uniref:type VI secretion system baseplate subunit TssK n=1 Tax=Erwinia TaxID=551 RepID=UPI000555BE24|nr:MULTISPECIES: type VI secretion system baseplate subunit TssK [Erwinia]
MNNAKKVVWTEGMFLRPHHFQQSESYQLSALRQWGSAQRPWMWGFLDYEIDEGMLQQGKIALSSASGLLPDGTFFSFRDANGAPPPIEIADNQIGEKVVLALPARRNGREEVIFSETADSLARYVSFEQEVDDFNAMSVGAAAVQFGKLRLRLMPESELSAEWTAMAVVSVAEKRSDNQVQLDSSYIPPMLHSGAHSQLDSWLNDIAGLLMQRSQQIGQRLQQPGRFNTADLVDFMLLALINHHVGQASHLKNLPLLHPEKLFAHWLAFACELTTYTPSRTPDALPVYDHDDLARCFSKLMLTLRQGLSLVMEENAIQLPLTERSHGLNVATVPTSSMVHDFGFVLAVRANVPGDMLQTHFPAQMKVAPVTKIRDLVQLQLPGMVLRAMPAAPPQIPWHVGYSYFELEKGSELWLEMEKSGTFALHLAGDFPGLTMEFWAVRNHSA